MIKKYIYEFEHDDDDTDYRCILRQIQWEVGYCYPLDRKCKGKFDDRP
jgi:hypothetical protein